jgi:hypothetical protein
MGSRAPDTIKTGAQLDGIRVGERRHCSQQHCTCKLRWPQEEHSRRDICAIGIAQRDRRGDAIARAGICNEIREFIRAPAHIVFVKNPFGQPSKKARHAIFQNLASRRKQ